MNTAYLIIAGLFVATLLIALMFTGNKRSKEPEMVEERVPVPPMEGQSPRVMQRSESEKHFRTWLSVLYQDSPYQIDSIVEDVARELRADGFVSGEFPVEYVMSFGVGSLAANHAFAVYRIDGDSFIAMIGEMAKRFRCEVVWSEQERESVNIDECMKTAYAQLFEHNAVLFHAKTDDDYYFFAVVPKRDAEEFVQVSERWGMIVRTADQPY